MWLARPLGQRPDALGTIAHHLGKLHRITALQLRLRVFPALQPDVTTHRSTLAQRLLNPAQTVTLPLERAIRQLRPPVDEADSDQEIIVLEFAHGLRTNDRALLSGHD